jgi:protein Hikeshi
MHHDASINMSVPFAVCFVGNSYPIPGEQFTQAGPTQYVLDVVSVVSPQFWSLKEVVLFLTAPNVLDAQTGLGLYIKCGAGEWQYRGCVHATHPSEAMPLVWPDLPQGLEQGPPGSVLLGAHLASSA